MLSERKLHANRLNAQKSTGPRTDAGKECATPNAIEVGVFSGRDLVLPGESQEEYDQLHGALLQSASPRDAIELAIVERMIAARWKLRRVNHAQRRQFENEAKVEVI